ncbi:MAG: hypothetical protein WC352_07495 [Candidatus Omnitrophota bacterium]|jgi:hypothetical protein
MSTDENEMKMKQMDEAAEAAKKELHKSFADWTARDIVAWWSRWYLKAGHKRLGRTLVALGKKPVNP